MQGNQPKQNVVSIFARREKDEAVGAPTEAEEAAPVFDDVMSKNSKNAERLAKERANANKSVLRSYRIKH